MELTGKTIGVAMSGSFCTYENAFQELQKLVEAGAKVQTIFSEAAQTIDSRFGKAEEFVRRAEILTGRTPMLTIAEAEPIGPKSLLDRSSARRLLSCLRHIKKRRPNMSEHM